ncbi:hypothetical protein ACFPM1_00155 [Halorubrum rubrum]|uniref:Uncharacterized protein n=1 Tax=Halorubrum rubrum TaxID=1126240 RepID=A0ABD5QXG7_9EURY
MFLNRIQGIPVERVWTVSKREYSRIIPDLVEMFPGFVRQIEDLDPIYIEFSTLYDETSKNTPNKR